MADDQSLADQVAAKQAELEELQRTRAQSTYDAQKELEDARFQRELDRLDAAIENEKNLIAVQDAANQMKSAVEGSAQTSTPPDAPPAPPTGPEVPDGPETPGGVLPEDTVSHNTADPAEEDEAK